MNNPKTISIIGGNGQMGKKFAKEFIKQGYEVLISDKNTRLTNKKAVQRSDVVIITVPVRSTEDVINEIAPFVKKNSLITDFTSVKIRPIVRMVKKINEDTSILGGHPLFGQTTDFDGQNFIICRERGEKYIDWYIDFLKSLGLNVLEMSKEEHDKNMAVIQCLTHFSTLSLGFALEKLQYNLYIGKKIATPVYLMKFYCVGRILAQDSELYTDIQMYNPFAKDIAKIYKQSVDELFEAVNGSDANMFNKIFTKSKKYFGDFAIKSMKVTDKLIKTLL